MAHGTERGEFRPSVKTASDVPRHDAWSSGDLYEPFVGRWSRLVAHAFLRWLGEPAGGRWLDVGCGTGALTETILATCEPRSVTGIDPSEGFATFARARVRDGRTQFRVADAQAMPLEAASFDAVVAGLVLNFVSEFLRYFWDAAVEVRDVATTAIDVPTVFRDFTDYWSPFLGGQGPAPGYTTSLAEAERAGLRELLRRRLPAREDGSIHLTARAWAVTGRRE